MSGFCVDCHKKLNTRNKHQKRCLKCYKKLIKVENLYCIDCGKKLNKYRKSKRCYSCNNIYQWKIGNRKSSSYKYKNILKKRTLYNKYIKNKLSLSEIAKIFKVSKCTVLRYLKLYKISVRSLSESKKSYKVSEQQKIRYREIFKGEGNPNWQGGLNKDGYSYRFNKQLKEKIRNRDNRICQCCGLKENNHIRGNKQIKLTVHHIDYNKQNCKEDNLISLCNKCNIKANTNRDYWYSFYKYKIEENIGAKNDSM